MRSVENPLGCSISLCSQSVPTPYRRPPLGVGTILSVEKWMPYPPQTGIHFRIRQHHLVTSSQGLSLFSLFLGSGLTILCSTTHLMVNPGCHSLAHFLLRASVEGPLAVAAQVGSAQVSAAQVSSLLVSSGQFCAGPLSSY